MRVSVVVPVLNEAKLIGKFLEGVLTQTIRPMELIVADGGSRDGTLEVIGKYGKRLKRMGIELKIVFSSPGIVKLRDLGFRIARGEVIASMDADTYYPPAYLETAAGCLNKEVVGVTGPSRLLDPPGFAVLEKVVQAARDRLIFKLTGTCFYPRAYNLTFLRQAYLNTPGMNIIVPVAEDEVGLAKLLNTQGKITYCEDLVPTTSSRRYKKGLGYFLFRTIIYDYWWGYWRAKYLGQTVEYDRVD